MYESDSLTMGDQRKKIRRSDLLYPELSYQIIGALFDVFNGLGYGYREYVYQRALRERFSELKIDFQEQVSFPLLFRGRRIAFERADFLIDRKIVLELKRGLRITNHDIEQILSYLQAGKFQLGILARFSSHGLIHRRILNEHSYIRKDS